MFSRKLLLITSIFTFLIFPKAGLIAQDSNTYFSKLKAKIDTINNSRVLKNAAWGLCVIDCETGNILLEHNSETGLIPASSLKISTTAASLSILGSNFRFETKLQYSGEIDSSSGTLRGNLYIKGGGDPTFCSDFNADTKREKIFYTLFNALNKKGIKKIEGKIIGDESIYSWDRIPGSWAWEDIGSYYGAGPCGLSFNNNLYKMIFNPGSTINSSAVLKETEPKIPGIKYINKVTTSAATYGEDVFVYSSPWSETCYITGTVPLNVKNTVVRAALTDPAYTCSKIFNSYLINKGIAIALQPTTSRIIEFSGDVDTSARKDIITIYSPPLNALINYINITSDNTYAESLLNMCGYQKLNQGNTKGGISSITAYWKSKGIDTGGLQLADGSGLSRKNHITAKQLSSMLHVYTKEPAFNTFLNSLPLAGKDGIIKNMFKGSNAEKNLRAKTGTMQGIRSFAGYVKNKSGKRLAFAIIVNNYSGSHKDVRKTIEELLIMLSDS